MSHRWHVGQTKSLSTTVKNNGVLTDAPEITFIYRIGHHGPETTVVPTKASTGIYFVTITPDRAGNMFCRWDSDGALDVVAEPIYVIRRSSFYEQETSDYT